LYYCFFKGIRECFAFAEGSACGLGKTKYAVCAAGIQNILCGGEKIKTQKGGQ